MSRRLLPLSVLLVATLTPMWATASPGDFLPAQGSAAGEASSSVMGRGVTTDVSFATTPGSDDPGPADVAAISDDGRYVAYEAYPVQQAGAAAAPAATRVMLRDTNADAPVLISPHNATAFAPSLAGDGRTLAYAERRQAAVDVFVVDVSDPARPVRRRVTDRPSDVEYQRTADCTPPTVTEIDTTIGRCGPVLSGDGRSVAIPSELSTVSPQLLPRIEDQADAPYLDPPGRHGLALVDFDAPLTPGTDRAPDLRVIAIRVGGPRAVRFDDLRTSGDPGFSIVRPEDPDHRPACERTTVEPGATCYVGIRFARPEGACGATAVGSLSIAGATPAGQTMIGLAGTHGCATNAGARAEADPAAAPGDCPPLADSADTADIGAVRAAPRDAWTALSLEETEIATTTVASQRIRGGRGAPTFDFLSDDCALQLVSPAGAQDPCTDGKILDAEDPTCTAYVAFRPAAVRTSVATIRLRSDESARERVIRFVGAGKRSVIVMRRAAASRLSFADDDSPDAALVSVSDAGQVVTGFAPSVSSTGRYLAFVSGFPDGRSDQDRPQVLVHDTDAAGDRSWRSGSTTNVSVADGDRQVEAAVQPSISGDGNRVAFVELLRQAVCTCTFLGARVQVRDLTQGVSRVVAGPDAPTTPTFNVAPSMSRDGAVVAFASDDPGFVPPGGQTEGLPQIYLQDLPVDLSSPLPERTILSLARDDTNVGWTGSPAVDANGSVVAFTSSAPLTDQGRRCCGDDARQVFTRTRFGRVRLSQEELLFAAPVPGFAGDVEYAGVINDGPGPIRVSASAKGPFRITQTCGSSLAAGQECRVGIQHVPPPADDPHAPTSTVDSGRAGTLTLHIHETAAARVLRSVPLVIWRHSLEPAAVEFTDVLVGTESEPQSIQVTNGSDHPLALMGVLLPPGATPAPIPTSAFAPVIEDDFALVDGGEDQTDADDGDDGDGADGRDNGDGEDGEEDGVEADAGSCGIVDPGETCEIAVEFTPTKLRGQNRWLAIGTPTVFPPYWEAVEYARVTGRVEEPTLTTSPTVAREGRVVFVTGTGFMPDVPVSLGWSGGPVSVAEIVPDGEGAFTAPVVVVSGRPGVHELTVTIPAVGTVTAAPVLVVPGSLQPPDFTGRN